jgi:hypothetical protein
MGHEESEVGGLEDQSYRKGYGFVDGVQFVFVSLTSEALNNVIAA